MDFKGIRYSKPITRLMIEATARIEPCTRKGIYINNVACLTMKNVTVEGADGEAKEILNVDEIR